MDEAFDMWESSKTTYDYARFFPEQEDFKELENYPLPEKYVAVAVGSRHATKQIPAETLEAVAEKCRLPLVFLGDSNDAGIVSGIERRFPDRTMNLCGKLSLRASAACVAKAETLLTGDTGLMHIAAALQKRTVSVWGNTVPAFGMYPYQPHIGKQQLPLPSLFQIRLCALPAGTFQMHARHIAGPNHRTSKQI